MTSKQFFIALITVVVLAFLVQDLISHKEPIDYVGGTNTPSKKESVTEKILNSIPIQQVYSRAGIPDNTHKLRGDYKEAISVDLQDIRYTSGHNSATYITFTVTNTSPKHISRIKLIFQGSDHKTTYTFVRNLNLPAGQTKTYNQYTKTTDMFRWDGLGSEGRSFIHVIWFDIHNVRFETGERVPENYND